ncbi:DUF6979 family protein [Paenibacillus piscarius]|uniref:DUF6979 family protein n=1 Tax=Paenibacillus piscarius TaxID=1089681 RepID=UPI001EE93054|nr:hypothetical protein [Paenibacillus piscarius]
MSKYGLAAIKAASLIKDEPGCTPLNGWNQSTNELYGENTHSQRKGCPKNAFLGLCEEGLIRGISKGNYAYKRKSHNSQMDVVLALWNKGLILQEGDQE